MGRTEWLKFTAAFFNAEALAEKRFADIVAQYQQYAALVQEVPTDQRPTVFGRLSLARHLARRRWQELRSAIGRRGWGCVPVGRRRFRGKFAFGF